MNSNELRAERIRKEKDINYMASLINKSYDVYRKKENGDVKFSPDEIVSISLDLELNEDKLNDIFFDGMLPIGKNRLFNHSVV